MTAQELDVTGDRPETSNRRDRAALVVVPLLSATFGFVGGFVIHQPLAMAGFGLLWGVVVVLFAARLARRGARSTGWANAPIHVMLPLAFIVLGGSIIGHLAGPTPTTFLHLLDQPGYTTFFAALHLPFEWLLMPWALIVNWHHPARRRLLIAAAVIFYLGRCASALYFAPTALNWAAHPAEAADHLDQVAQWIRLDLVRLVLQDALNATLLLAAALHHRMSPTPVSPA
jgi:hypothetical protein